MNSSLKYLEVDIFFQKHFSYKLNFLSHYRAIQGVVLACCLKDLIHVFEVVEFMYVDCSQSFSVIHTIPSMPIMTLHFINDIGIGNSCLLIYFIIIINYHNHQ